MTEQQGVELIEQVARSADAQALGNYLLYMILVALLFILFGVSVFAIRSLFRG